MEDDSSTTTITRRLLTTTTTTTTGGGSSADRNASMSSELSSICGALDAALSRQPTSSLQQRGRAASHLDNSASLGLGGAHAPTLPDWALRRPAITGDFYPDAASSVATEQDQSSDDQQLPLARQAPGGKAGSGVGVGVGGMNVQAQETCLLEDLLYALVGIEGRLVRVTAGMRFVVDEGVDVSVRALAAKVLPLADCYLATNRFALSHMQYERGRVCHALSAAMLELLKEHLVFVAQLEHQLRLGRLTLHKTVFHVQEPLRTLSVLRALVAEISSLVPEPRGGALLDLLFRKATAVSGDERSSEVYAFLLRKAAVPFSETLVAWLSTGSMVTDSYGEFMIEEREDLRKDDIGTDYLNAYWDQRYSLRNAMIPAFAVSSKEKILRTGKYLSVVRECGGVLDQGEMVDMAALDVQKPSEFERQVTAVFEKAHERASRALLDLLTGEKVRLVPRLKSLKHYFLLDQGDFFVHFMDIAEKELAKRASQVTPARLNTLLQLATRTSPLENDLFRGSIECQLLPWNLLTQLLEIIKVKGDGSDMPAAFNPLMTPKVDNLTALEAFAFDCQIEFPLSLVLNRGAIVKYQLLLRFLLLLKHVERRLNAAWVAHMDTRVLGGVLQPLHMLRHRMILFIKNYVGFVVNEVIEPNWALFMTRLSGPETRNLDDVLRHHVDFLDSCLMKTALTDPELVEAIMKITSACLLFVDFAENTDRNLTHTILNCATALRTEEEKQHGPATTAAEVFARESRKAKAQVTTARRFLSTQAFINALAKHERNFSSAFFDFERSLQAADSGRMGPLLMALDYNNYYKDHKESPMDMAV